jgi:hypothetical protein
LRLKVWFSHQKTIEGAWRPSSFETRNTILKYTMKDGPQDYPERYCSELRRYSGVVLPSMACADKDVEKQ